MTILQAEARLTTMRATYDDIVAQVRAVPKSNMPRAFALEDRADHINEAMLAGPEREIATAVPTSLEELAVQLRLLATYTNDEGTDDDDAVEMLTQTLAKNALAYVEGLLAGGIP